MILENEADKMDTDEPETRSFLVRQNCEYSIEVEAVDEEDACSQANAVPISDWGQAWSSMEAE